MANYPKELTDLLQQYMTDGIMTEKERAVLLRKAESLGVDKDEFDLFIDAEEQKFEQKIDAAKRQAKGKLCPFCEASVPMFTDKCPECGCHITPEVTKELNDIIENLEDAVVNFKSTKNVDLQRNKANVERYVRKAEMYYGNNKKIQVLIAEVKKEIELVEKRVSVDKRKEMALSGAGKFGEIIVFLSKKAWTWFVLIALVGYFFYDGYDNRLTFMIWTIDLIAVIFYLLYINEKLGDFGRLLLNAIKEPFVWTGVFAVATILCIVAESPVGFGTFIAAMISLAIAAVKYER